MERVRGLILTRARGVDADAPDDPFRGLGGGPLATVANKPLIQHALEALHAAEVRDVTVTVAPNGGGEAIRSTVRDGTDWGMTVHYLEQSDPLDSATALRSDRLDGAAPVLVAPGDALVVAGIAQLVRRFERLGIDALCFVAPRSSRGGGELVPLDSARLPRGLAGEEVGLSATGMYLLGPRTLASIRAASTRETSLTEALERIASHGGRVEAQTVSDWWRYDGRPSSLLEGNRLMLDTISSSHSRTSVVDSDVQGRVTVDPSARVEATVVRGPVVIGAHARVSNAYVGPYTSVGAGAVIDCAEVEHSVILPGASVTNVGGRLEDSVVGARARVFRDFALPRALRLRVGSGAEIRLS